MAPLAPLPNPPKPLPQLPGPKLAPFTRTAHAAIQFVQELGDETNSSVFMKFTFTSFEYLRDDLGGCLIRDLASPQLYNDYFDPFNCECRAYGRLKEENREDLAVRAHGYLLLTPQQEAEITKRITGIDNKPAQTEPDSSNPWDRREEHRYLPIRAIVKDLVSNQDAFTPAQVSSMWADLEDLHGLGILVGDINVFNYLGGKLIDFSRSWTTPHPWSRAMDPEDVRRARERDPHGLLRAIIEWGMGNGWDWDEVVIPDKLRKCASGKGEIDFYGIDPALYDWRKWERDPVAADEFLEHELFVRVESDH